jgi:hypothetical protein
LQKKAELIATWLAENQPKLGAAGREKQSNITDYAYCFCSGPYAIINENK